MFVDTCMCTRPTDHEGLWAVPPSEPCWHLCCVGTQAVIAQPVVFGVVLVSVSGEFGSDVTVINVMDDSLSADVGQTGTRVHALARAHAHPE